MRVTWRALCALIVLASAGVVSAAAGSASADSYAGTVRTRCEASAVQVVRDADMRPSLTVHIDTVGNAQPEGQLLITYTRPPSGFSTTQTVAYHGSTVHVRGPVLRHSGAYHAQVSFRADRHSVWKGCSADVSFKRVHAIADTHGHHHHHHHQGGGGPGVVSPSSGDLPNTGSPVTLPLLLGALALIAVGGGLLVESRRRRTSSGRRLRKIPI